MTHKLLGIGATIVTIALGAAFVAAQGAGQGQAGAPPPQGQNPPVQGGVGPGRGPGQGQVQGAGPGQQMNQGVAQGQGRAAMGRGRGMGPQGPGAGPGSPANELAGLNLTPDQRGTIEQLNRSTRDQGAPFQDELQFAQKTLHRELFADKRDAAKIASLQTKISALEKQLADLRIKTAMAVSDVLTAQQRETMRLHDGGGAPAGRGRGGPR